MEDPGGIAAFPEILLFPVLILWGGFFSLFETALSSSRKAKLRKAAEDGGAKYRRALEAAESPAFLLGAARIWNALLRILAGATAGFGAARYLIPGPDSSGDPFAGILVCALILLFLSIAAVIAGDTIPSFIARAAPERITAAVLPLMNLFGILCRPAAAIADRLSALIRAVFDTEEEDASSEAGDELRQVLEEGNPGAVKSRERTMVEGVFYLGDRPVGTFMTHRSEIQWLDIHAGREEMLAAAAAAGLRGCIPVADGTPDHIRGAVYPEDLYLALLNGLPGGLGPVIRRIRFIPETMSALKALEAFKGGGGDYFFVMDEYGGFAGMVSARNLIDEIVELSGSGAEEEGVVKQEDGSWLAPGAVNIDDISRILSLEELAGDHQDYHTLAGFILSLSGEIPRAGEVFESSGYRFTVTGMDGNRIDRVRISPLTEQAEKER
ncbi:MAG: hemolysin family protein [Treponema sp.]|jgi:putative hemolysin|nr:hemolysin family protein [Treponema sp.]